MSIKGKLKAMLQSGSPLLKISLACYNRLPFNNVLRGKGVHIGRAQLKKCRIYDRGVGNRILIGDGCRLSHCTISVYGNGNTVTLGKFVSGSGLHIAVEDDGNTVALGDKTTFSRPVHLAAIEGTRLMLGEDCMLSANISVRTGDSHSVVDLEGNRINPSKDVIIGNHVWIGNTVLITKGAHVADNSIIGTGSVVTRAFETTGVVVAGNPAKIVKEHISWKQERLPM